ncbi:MAG: hypothetical protein ACI9FR_000865 [Cryomorphaceae bacterium]|jgi:hypothetical protein
MNMLLEKHLAPPTLPFMQVWLLPILLASNILKIVASSVRGNP